MNNEFKLNNNIEFIDEETKIEYEKYLEKINDYNRKVSAGEKPDFDLSEMLNEFNKKFDVDGFLDKEVVYYDVDGLLKSINDSLNEEYRNSESDLAIDKINSRIKELDEKIDN